MAAAAPPGRGCRRALLREYFYPDILAAAWLVALAGCPGCGAVPGTRAIVGHDGWPVIIASYEIGSRAARWAWVFLACLTALTIPAAVAPVVQLPGAQGVPFLVGFLLLWALLFYAMAFRAIYRLDLAEAELRWHSLLRTGVIPLGEL